MDNNYGNMNDTNNTNNTFFMNFSLSLNDRVHGFHGCNINPTIELFYRPFGLCEKQKSCKTMW